MSQTMFVRTGYKIATRRTRYTAHNPPTGYTYDRSLRVRFAPGRARFTYM